MERNRFQVDLRKKYTDIRAGNCIAVWRSPERCKRHLDQTDWYEWPPEGLHTCEPHLILCRPNTMSGLTISGNTDAFSTSKTSILLLLDWFCPDIGYKTQT